MSALVERSMQSTLDFHRGDYLRAEKAEESESVRLGCRCLSYGDSSGGEVGGESAGKFWQSNQVPLLQRPAIGWRPEKPDARAESKCSAALRELVVISGQSASRLALEHQRPDIVRDFRTTSGLCKITPASEHVHICRNRSVMDVCYQPVTQNLQCHHLLLTLT